MTWAQHDILGGPVEGILTTRQRDPEADTTALEREKITDYLLNPAHRYGASKARFFAAIGKR